LVLQEKYPHFESAATWRGVCCVYRQLFSFDATDTWVSVPQQPLKVHSVQEHLKGVLGINDPFKQLAVCKLRQQLLLIPSGASICRGISGCHETSGNQNFNVNLGEIRTCRLSSKWQQPKLIPDGLDFTFCRCSSSLVPTGQSKNLTEWKFLLHRTSTIGQLKSLA